MAGADGKAKQVLVIDDDPSIVALYRDVLEDERYRVATTASPELAPAAVAALGPDLLLLDLRFGHDVGGVDLIARLRGDPATRTLPVLVCSAATALLAELDDQLRAWDCGVLAKPFGLDDLLAAVARGLASPEPAGSGADAVVIDPTPSVTAPPF